MRLSKKVFRRKLLSFEENHNRTTVRVFFPRSCVTHAIFDHSMRFFHVQSRDFNFKNGLPCRRIWFEHLIWIYLMTFLCFYVFCRIFFRAKLRHIARTWRNGLLFLPWGRGRVHQLRKGKKKQTHFAFSVFFVSSFCFSFFYCRGLRASFCRLVS